MCGITGILHFHHPLNERDLDRATHALAHRGPDGLGTKCWKNLGIGHSRLAIIDCQFGAQPMPNGDHTIWIVFNGEIYNYRELRRDLENRSYIFKTLSDTEVILHSYEEWGADCLNHFRGMFAFGIVDLKKRQLFIARDHFGIKPLVYYHDQERFAFASELNSLYTLSNIRFELDLTALDQFLALQYIPAPKTVFKNFFKLPPAHYQIVSFDGAISKPVEYWDLSYHPVTGLSEGEWLERVDDTLRDSVKAHMVSDVPFGAFLSGGIDSSLTVGYMASLLSQPVRTFSIGFEEKPFNELEYAAIVARRWGTSHHEQIICPNALEILPQLVQSYGEPFGDSSAIPTWYVSRLARAHVPMVLSGDGGDELFAGYQSYALWRSFIHGTLSDNRPLWKKIAGRLQSILMPHRSPPPRTTGPTLSNWLSFIHYLPTPLRFRLWRPEFRSVVTQQIDCFEQAFHRFGPSTSLNLVQYMDLKTYLPGDILTKVDIASMAHGLEIRTPFIDRRVAELAATLPEEFLFETASDGFRGKRLLRTLLLRHFEPPFLDRSKQGFALPLSSWLLPSNAQMKDLIHATSSPSSPLANWFDPRIIRDIFHRGLVGPMWLILFLHVWLSALSATGRPPVPTQTKWS